jgi:hypothetical protein
VGSVQAGFDASNLLAATLIASDPKRYQGVLQEWADLILTRAAQPDDALAGPLFESRAA